MSKYNMKVRKMQEDEYKNFVQRYVKMVKQHDIIDVVRMSIRPRPHIKKISKNLYQKGFYHKGEFYSTGEVFEMIEKTEHKRNRRSLRKIFVDLRQLICTNFWSKSGFQLFVTLTYRDQTNDHVQVHNDFRKFWQRLKRKWGGAMDYISIVEPHASGMFHIHLLLTTYFIPPPWGERTTADIGRELHDIWGLGYVKAELLNSVDNIGAYFIAYFSNMELSDEEAEEYGDDVVEKNGKKFIKGMRLDFYPDYMQIYRHSRGIRKPEEGNFDLDGYKRTYQSLTALELEVESGDDVELQILKEQYKQDDD